MAQQEEGWPLRLQPLNVRAGLTRNGGDFSGSVSFNTLITGSPTSSTDSSSDLDTESTGSFFHDNSVTLGSLMGVSSSSTSTALGNSRRTAKAREADHRGQNKSIKAHKKKPRKEWLFSICSRVTTDELPVTNIINNNNDNNNNNNNNPPSLGHFLALERERATNETNRRSLEEGPNNNYGLDDFALSQAYVEPINSLFVNDLVAPPRPSPLMSRCNSGNRQKRRRNWRILKNDGNRSRGISPVFLCCICGKSS